MTTTLKRNTYGCLFGNQMWGCSVLLITPHYENNCILHVFDIDNPRLYVSGVGGRISGPNGKMVQAYHQIEGQNRPIIVSRVFCI